VIIFKFVIISVVRIDTLNHHPHLYNELIATIEEAFHYERGIHHYDIDFYPLMRRENHPHCYILFDNDGTFIGHAGVLEKKLFWNDVELPVVFLGGIVIKKEFQGRGLSRMLLENIFERYQQNVALFILWSDKPDYYKRFGFYSCGGMKELSLIQDADKHWTKLTAGNFEEIEKLRLEFYKDTFTTRRDPDDYNILKKITSANIFIKKDSHGKITHYFIKDKGRDLTNIIHESNFVPGFGTSWLPENRQEGLLVKSMLAKIGNISDSSSQNPEQLLIDLMGPNGRGCFIPGLESI